MSEYTAEVSEVAAEIESTASWLRLLYEECEPDDGVMVFIAAERNRIHSVHGFGSPDDLTMAARDVAGQEGLYLKINPMDYDKMRKRATKERKPVVGGLAEVKTLVSFHLDVDAGKGGKYLSREHALWAVDQMPIKPTLIVNSNGQTGGFHVYWVLERPVRILSDQMRNEIQDISHNWNQRLKELCAGKLDTTGNLDRVLRVFGSRRTDGGRVMLHSYEKTNLYGVKDFTL